MPANYNGDTTGITGHPTVTISEPVGTDVRDSGSVRTPLRRLADFLQYVATNFALTSEVTADIATHNGVTNPHSATSAATASRLVLRDAAGRAKMADGSAADDIATKGQIDAVAPARAHAWADLVIGAAGAVTINRSHNVASASWSGNQVTINYSVNAATAYHAAVATRNEFADVPIPDYYAGDAAYIKVSQYARSDGTAHNYVAGDKLAVIVFA